MKTIKAIFCSMALIIFLGSSAIAQEQQQGQQGQQGQQEQQMDQGQQDRTEIASQNLPEKVTQAISEGNYAGWTITRAYQVQKDGETMYEVHFRSPEGETEKQLYNRQGEEAKERK